MQQLDLHWAIFELLLAPKICNIKSLVYAVIFVQALNVNTVWECTWSEKVLWIMES